MILGGYDASKFVPSRAPSYTIGRNGRQLGVTLSHIIYNSGVDSDVRDTSLTLTSTLAPRTSFMSLPTRICHDMEQAFGLSYDNSSNQYLINDTQHQSLLGRNASITFTLASDSIADASQSNITISYSNLNFDVDSPHANHTHRIFPLNQGSNSNDATLGMAFLRHASVISNQFVYK